MKKQFTRVLLLSLKLGTNVQSTVIVTHTPAKLCGSQSQEGDATNSILIRLDDKLGRVMSNTEDKPRVNDVCDIIGYCTLLLISMGVTAEDIAKFKD